MSDALSQLKTRLGDIHNLEMAGAVLGWDQQTYMPPGGVVARADQLATLSKISHQMFTSDETARLLEAAERENSGLPAQSDDACFLVVARRDFDKATKLPEELVTEISRVTSLAQEEWAKAREANEYSQFAPWLERILDLQRRTADALGYEDRLYDALLNQYEYGMTSAELDPIFEELKAAVIPLARDIAERADTVSDEVLHRDYDEDLQRAFAERVLKNCGYDWSRGRQDRSVHPFCTNFGRDDVRITTRYNRNDLQSALFGSMHEMGHALYEQGIDPALDGTLLGGGTSLGVHESQSRLWENLVGRSREFWSHYFPALREAFPTQLGAVSVEEFYHAMNRVNPSLIRVEADEVTYNLHIILRYEMENELLEERLSVADAPEAWNARMQEYLGIMPPSNREGILQDVHWSIGAMGYFPTYSLGNILSVQLWDKALQDEPSISNDIANGRFDALLGWLRENVHRHGRKFPPRVLVERATGRGLDVAPYAAYLKQKFSEVYNI
jgi:carboxypeptidase Taq